MSPLRRQLASFIPGRRLFIAVIAVVLVVGLVLVFYPSTSSTTSKAAPSPEVTASQAVTVPLETSTPSASPSVTSIVKPCRVQAKKPFRPVTVQLLGIASYPAVALDLVETATGVQLPVPPDESPDTFAVVKGDDAARDDSMLRLTAHTWGDGTALGNVINDKIRPGSIIVVHGAKDSQVACYQVADRVRMTIVGASSKQQAINNAVLDRYNGVRAEDDLGIMMCSGEHIAVGVYKDRLNVFATRYGA